MLRAVKANLVALFRIPHRRRRSLRHVRQLEARDCGAACLLATLEYLGVGAGASEVRSAVGAGRGGVSARTLLRAARLFGVNARGVRIEKVESLALLPRGSIMHWNGDHFVALDGVSRRGIRIVDPALGPREVSFSDADRSFTGVALVFEVVQPPPASGDAASRAMAARLRAFRRMARYLSAGRLWPVIIGASFFLAGSTLVFPLLLRHVVNTGFPGRAPEVETTMLLALLALVVTHVGLVTARAVALAWLRGRVDYRLTLTIFSRLFDLPYEFFEARSTGDLLLRVRSTAMLRQVFTGTFLSALVDGPMSIVLLVAISLLDWRLGAVVAGAVLLQVLTLILAWRRQCDLGTAALGSQAASQSRLVQMLAGSQAVKLAGAEREVVDSWSQLLADEVNREVRRTLSAGIVDSMITAIRIFAPVALLLVGIVEVASGRATLGTMLAAVTLGAVALVPIAALLSNVFQLASVAAYVERINDILDEPPEVTDCSPLPGALDSVQIRGVSFSYPGCAPLFTGIDLDILAGQSVAIVGQSGAGKSTLSMLIAGLRQPTEGTVSIANVPLPELDVRAVRRKVGFVPQQPFFFAGSIRDNMTLFRDFSEDAIRDAARIACIASDIEKLPAGYDTVLVEQGDSLSGGQLQRLGLARALLGEPQLLVLDEATSALDAATERAVLDSLLNLPVGKVFVTHRDSVSHRADRTFELTNGVLRLRPPGPLGEPVREPTGETRTASARRFV